MLSRRSKTGIWRASPCAAHSVRWVVTRTCPRPSGSRSSTLSGSPAPSSTSSQGRAVRSSSRRTALMVAARSPASRRPSSGARSANWVRAVTRWAAVIHQTMSYSPANRWAYSRASCVLPTPPGPRSARTAPSCPAPVRASYIRSRSSVRPMKRRLRRGTCHTSGGSSGKRGPRRRSTRRPGAGTPAHSRTRARATSGRRPRSSTGARGTTSAGSGCAVTLTAATRSRTSGSTSRSTAAQASNRSVPSRSYQSSMTSRMRPGAPSRSVRASAVGGRRSGFQRTRVVVRPAARTWWSIHLAQDSLCPAKTTVTCPSSVTISQSPQLKPGHD